MRYSTTTSKHSLYMSRPSVSRIALPRRCGGRSAVAANNRMVSRKVTVRTHLSSPENALDPFRHQSLHSDRMGLSTGKGCRKGFAGGKQPCWRMYTKPIRRSPIPGRGNHQPSSMASSKEASLSAGWGPPAPQGEAEHTVDAASAMMSEREHPSRPCAARTAAG